MKVQQRLLRGPAPTAALKLLEHGPLSGYQLLCRMRGDCPEATTMGDASLVALLHYLEGQHLITGAWQDADGDRRRTYQLTDLGQRRLAEEHQSWQSLASLFRANEASESTDNPARRPGHGP